MAARAGRLPGGLKRLRQLLRQGAGGDGGAVAGGAGGLPLGQAGGAVAGERGAAAGPGGAAAAVQDPEADASGGGARPDAGVARAVAALREGDARATGRVCSAATRRRTCRGRTTTWSTCSAATATTSVGPAAGKGASPGLVVLGSVRVVSGLATRLRPEEGLRLAGGLRGALAADARPSWRSAGRRDGNSGASAATPTATSRNWRNGTPAKFATLVFF